LGVYAYRDEVVGIARFGTSEELMDLTDAQEAQKQWLAICLFE
jgi:hypothetical protein